MTFESTEVIENRSDVRTHKNVLTLYLQRKHTSLEIYHIRGLDESNRNTVTQSEITILHEYVEYSYGFY